MEEEYIDTITGEKLIKRRVRDGIEYRNQYGELHRTDGPAVERADGTKKWYQNDELHRTDGPAVERANGDKLWFFRGKLRRTDGPAIEWSDGSKSWWQDDKLHRTDGPAVERASGHKEWYLNGKRFPSEEEFMQALKDDNLSYMMDLHDMIHPDVQKSSRDKIGKQNWSLKQALEDIRSDS